MKNTVIAFSELRGSAVKFQMLKTVLREVRNTGGYRSQRSKIKKVFQLKPGAIGEINYGIRGISKGYFQTASHNKTVAHIGCMVFSGVNYRRLRKWALA